MTYHQICDKSSTTDVTSLEGTVYHSGGPASVIYGVRVNQSVWCFVDLCLPFCPFSFSHCIVLLKYTPCNQTLIYHYVRSYHGRHRWCNDKHARLECLWHWSGQTKDYSIGICRFSSKHMIFIVTKW
jgi:hypothetical protein